MAASTCLPISYNRSRVKCRFQFRPTNSSRNVESVMARASTTKARSSDEHPIRLYLDMLAAERGAGTNTLAAYTRDLEDLAAFLKSTRRAIATARTADLRAYIEDLSRRGLRAATAARRLSAIRQLYRFLYAEGHRTDDPAAVLEGPKRQRALPKILIVAEVDRLLAAASRCDAEAPPAIRLRRRGSGASSRSCMRPAYASPNLSRCRSPPRGAM